MTSNNQHDDLLVTVSYMYYQDEMTHQQIADELALSRVQVTRLLQRARREGIVRFHISKPRPLYNLLGRDLAELFGLQKAIVVNTASTQSETLDGLGQAAAQFLANSIRPDLRIGIGWSTTVSRMAPYLQAPTKKMSLTVNELAGSMLGQNNPYSISAEMAKVLGAQLETLPVPAIVQSKEIREVMLQEDAICTALMNAGTCDVAFVGLGDVGPTYTMLKTNYMTAEQISAIRDIGAIGEVLLHYYDINGQQVSTTIDDRTITLGIDALAEIPLVIGMVSGDNKVDTILGAMRGKIINCLITDTRTAQQVLEKASV